MINKIKTYQFPSAHTLMIGTVIGYLAYMVIN